MCGEVASGKRQEGEKMYQVIERKVKCSKCGSLNIAKPANEKEADWVFKCFNCGHQKIKRPPTLKVGSFDLNISEEEFNKPIEF